MEEERKDSETDGWGIERRMLFLYVFRFLGLLFFFYKAVCRNLKARRTNKALLTYLHWSAIQGPHFL
jgi:hypothetical protein